METSLTPRQSYLKGLAEARLVLDLHFRKEKNKNKETPREVIQAQRKWMSATDEERQDALDMYGSGRLNP